MKWWVKSTVAALAALTAAASQAEFKDFTVDGVVVSKAMQQAQAKELMAMSHSRELTSEIEDEVRRGLTRMVVLAQAAKSEGLDKNPETQAELEMAANYVLYKRALAHYLDEHPVSERMIKRVYEEEKKVWGPTELELAHILVKTEAQARDIIREVQGGADFRKLAAEKSLDDDTKDEGGALGWQTPSVFGEDFRGKVEHLKKGEVAADPLQTPGGWHVIYVADTRDAQNFPRLEERREEIKANLTQQVLREYIEALEKKAVVR